MNFTEGIPHSGLPASLAPGVSQSGPRAPIGAYSMTIIENFVAAIILNWKTDHRLLCRPVPRVTVAANGGYFRPVNGWPDQRRYAGLAADAPGQAIAVRPCGYSGASGNVARSS